MVFLFSYRDVSTPTSSLSSFSLESPRSSFHESPSPCLSFNFDRRSPPTTEELSEFLQVFYICGQRHSFSLEIKAKIPCCNKKLTGKLPETKTILSQISGVGQVWEGSLQPDPVRQGAEGALPGGPDHPEGLPVLQGPQAGPSLERGQGQGQQRRARRPDRGRGRAEQGGQGGLCHPELLPPLQAGDPHPIWSAHDPLVPQYLVIYNYLPAVASLNYFPVALFTFFLS